MQTFVVKLASGVAALIASICLTVCNLSSDTVGAGASKAAASSVAGIRLTMTILPIAGLLAAIVLFHKKYILTEENIEKITAQIKEKTS